MPSISAEKQKAITLHRNGQLEAAKTGYKKYLKAYPDDAEMWHALGVLFWQQKNIPSAQQAYEKAILLNPRYTDAHCNLGILHTALQQNTLAITHLQKSLSLEPALTKALNQLGDLYLREEKYVEAGNVFLQSIAGNPDNAEIQCRLGIVYFRQHDFERAKKQFEITLILNHNHSEINQYLANTYLELSDHEKATHYYFRQLEQNPLFESYYNLGVLFMMKNRLREAETYFLQALKINSEDYASHLNLGNVYLSQQATEKAIGAYQKAQALKPTDLEIQHILSALTQKEIADKAPRAYVQHLFDQYAPYYEKHVADALKYDVPKKIIHLLELDNLLPSGPALKIMDLGCGTGLCGALLKPYAQTLIGIDLSGKMLAVARHKKIYDELICADMGDALSHQSAIDWIVAADALPYLGNLEPIFSNAQKALKPNGLFIFTVEKGFECDFTLQSSIRYAHSKTYLESLSLAHGFELLCLNNIELRSQKKHPVEGYIVILRMLVTAFSEAHPGSASASEVS